MKRAVLFVSLSAVVGWSGAAFADDDEVAENAPGEGTAETSTVEKAAMDKPYHTLPLCRVSEGSVEVLRPGSTTWEPIEEGRFYPFGCSYRAVTPQSRLRLQFGSECSVATEGVTSFGTVAQPIGARDRAITLQTGTVRVELPRNMQAGLFSVSAPGFKVVDLAGESLYTYSGTGDGDVATVRCVTGCMRIEGRHFKIPEMHAANEVRIRTSQDVLFTGLYGTSGDYIVKLDQGVVVVKDFETGEEKRQDSVLDWQLSPQTAVRIHRARPKIGERLSVTVMTFDASGNLVNRCAFAEGLAEINSGEQGEIALAARQESAKKAVESADAAAGKDKASSGEKEEANKQEEESTEE